MNKKIIILILLFIGAILLSTSSAYAINSDDKIEAKELLSSINSDIPIVNDFKKGEILSLSEISKKNNVFKVVKIKTTTHCISGGAIVKKNGKYQSKYRKYDKIRIANLLFEKKNNWQYKYYDWELGDVQAKFTGYKYTPAIKGSWVKVYNISPTKTIETKGKIYKIKYYTILRVINPKKAEKVKIIGEKTLIGHYYNINPKQSVKVYNLKGIELGIIKGKTQIGVRVLEQHKYYNKIKINGEKISKTKLNIFNRKNLKIKFYF